MRAMIVSGSRMRLPLPLEDLRGDLGFCEGGDALVESEALLIEELFEVRVDAPLHATL